MTSEELHRALGSPRAPVEITQEPLDDDPDHLHRLVQVAQTSGATARPRDVYTYAEDLSFVHETQADLFVFLLPPCLKALSDNLRGATRDYVAFVNQFWVALNKRPGPLDLLSSSQHDAVDRYLREAILEEIDACRPLRNSRSGASCYRWFYTLGSYATIFPNLRDLWLGWWSVSTEGRAIGVLQYVSCLMYENSSNPVFDAWTPKYGGGPPELWTDDMSVNEQPWHPINVEFLRGALTPPELSAAIAKCVERLADPDRGIALQMQQDFARQRVLLELRIEQLLSIVSANHFMVHGWTI